jgi:hypothetical protein
MPRKRGSRKVIKIMAEKNEFPGRYVANPVFRRKFRYQAQASETKDSDYVTMGSLQNLQYVAYSATGGSCLFSAVRLRSVEVWADSSATNTLSTIGLDWLSADSPNKQVNATGNAMHPAHFKVRPPKGSIADRWTAIQLPVPGVSGTPNATPYAFALISSVAGAICDVELEFTLFDYDTLNNPPTVVTAGATLGLVYTNSYLDNTSVSCGSGTKNWLVQGMANTLPAYIQTV